MDQALEKYLKKHTRLKRAFWILECKGGHQWASTSKEKVERIMLCKYCNEIPDEYWDKRDFLNKLARI